MPWFDGVALHDGQRCALPHLPGRFIGNVEQAGDGGAASCRDQGHRPLWPFRTAPVGEHQRTRRGERRGNFQPEPSPCARDQGDFAL
jgi:hypothetical protein